MRTIVIAAAMGLCVVSLATRASADTLYLRDGSYLEGTVIGIAGRTITFRHADRANPPVAGGRQLDVPAGTELVVRRLKRSTLETSVSIRPSRPSSRTTSRTRSAD
jgi:hypothetical protein